MAKDGYRNFIQYPSPKEPPYNDWMEYDGLEVDLSSLPLAPREFSVTFEFAGPNVNVKGFVDCLGASSVTFNSVEAGVQKTVRCLGYSGYATYSKGATLTVNFIEDMPSAVSASLPSQTLPTDNYFKLDGVPLSRYNVRVLKGSEAEALMPWDNKQYLTRSSRYTSGQTYDGGGYKVLKERDMTIHCLMTADTLTHFHAFYNALLYSLVYKDDEQADSTKACQRSLYVGYDGNTHKCYYKGQSVNGFYPFGSSRIWCQFDLTFGLVGSVGGEPVIYDMLLATENDLYVITENVKLIRI